MKNTKDGRGSWKAVLRNSWFDVFGGCFEYYWRTSEKHYSALEFKVIDIV
jgi:hypothetical protein